MNRVKIKEWFKKPTVIRIILLIAVQALLALLFDVFGLGAGSIGTFTFLEYASRTDPAEVFAKAGAFIILLYPPLLSSDGGIGVLVSRLGTGLHLGSIKPKMLKNTKQYYTLISASLTLGAFNGLWIGVISYLTNLVALGTNRIPNPMPFIVIPILTLTFASLISSQIASFMAFFMFKKKMNPDIWVYPTMSTVNNILSTLFYAAMISMLKPANWYNETGFNTITRGTYFAFIPVFLYLVLISVLVGFKAKNKEYRKILKQAVPVQSVTLTINSLTGGILSGADVALKNISGLFLVYPALIDTLGDEITIVANTTSTNLALGTIKPKLSAIKDKDLWTNLVGVGLAGLVLHLFYGIFGSIIVGDFQNIVLVLGISLLINIIGFIVVQSVAFLLIILAFKRGLDPDNLAVPVIAALSNLVSSTLLFLLTLPLIS
ncbi:MAG: magnesium transporter [Candidatus Heimdallarchaeota archaeon]|nr:magnesium transporter [Candidatus Heimdallarchaeota archaeon]MBY8993423.1 magnesium transporter [Candidatus Heimdallarchaeota archaeon]